MCGIVGAIAQRDVSLILLEGLKRLEYRGYDSAGMAIIDSQQTLNRLRVLGKVSNLEKELQQTPLLGNKGVAHTRWATHGNPSTENAHPHICHDNEIALVHNGIIENHNQLRESLQQQAYQFTSETDTEVIIHQIHAGMQKGNVLFTTVKQTIKNLHGAYAIGVIHKNEPDTLIAARQGSPLVIGLGFGENFIASDVCALLPVTQRFIFLEDGDIAIIKRDSISIYDENGQAVSREEKLSTLSINATDKGE